MTQTLKRGRVVTEKLGKDCLGGDPAWARPWREDSGGRVHWTMAEIQGKHRWKVPTGVIAGEGTGV